MKRIYLSGPMTGHPEHNYPAFHEAEKIVAEQFPDVAIENPARNFNGETGLPRDTYLREDLRNLAKCDGIVMLAGWTKSRGSCMEYLIASELGIPCWSLGLGCNTSVRIPGEARVVIGPKTERKTE